MSHSAIILSTILLLTSGAFGVGTLAQTRATDSVDQPGTEASSRPTLKRRQAAPDVSMPVSLDGVQSTEKKNNGELKNAADNSVPSQKPTWLRFEGLKNLSEENLLWFLRQERVNLPDLQTDPTKLVVEIKKILADLGWDNATVDVRDEGYGSVKTLVVTEGERVPIQTIRFEGNRAFPTETLAAEFFKCVERYQLKASKNDMDLCLRLVLNSARSKGYLQAKFGEPKKEVLGSVANVTVSLEEGARYRVGKIEIEGAEHISPERILEILDIKSGDIADGEKIGKGLFEKLKDLYSEHGFLQYTGEPEPELHPVSQITGEGIVDFRIIIEEGSRFKIRSITFEGYVEVARESFRSALLIREGDYFNQKLFRDSIKELGKLGVYLDPDKDTIFKSDDETALLDITILLGKVD